MMLKEPAHHLQPILRATAHLSQSDLLELITYLAQQAQQTTNEGESISWVEMEGIAPNLLGGEDAQEWVTQSREAGHRELG